MCVCGAYGKTLYRSAVSHTPASQIELALTAPSAGRVYVCVLGARAVGKLSECVSEAEEEIRPPPEIN